MGVEFLHPRPEYPRPEKQRGTVEGFDWINLNGPWAFRFDPGRQGVAEQWFVPDELDWREQIIVPFCWESLAAWGDADAAGNGNYYATRVFRNPLEVTRQNHRSAARYEVGWYRRSLEIPADGPWQGKRVILHIGAADFFTDCWCNGRHLGHHEGGYTPFEFDLTEALPGADASGKRRAAIVLRVEDPMENSEQPVGKQWRWYTTTSGIWQTVFIEPRDPAHIRSFKVYADIDAGAAEFRLACEHAPDGAEIEAQIIGPDGLVQRERLPVRDGQAGGVIKLDGFALWDPNEPNLYDTVLRLTMDGRVTDCLRTYFGLRKVDFELAPGSGAPTGLRLNGVPRYLRGALYQSYYPDGVYTATSLQTIQDDLLHAKKFGFNFLRVHLKLDDPLLLYCADKLGVLLMADFPNFGEGGDTPLGRRRFETMLREGIERDFNHPAIFAWCLFNETWGFGGQTGFLEALVDPVRSKELAAGTRPSAPPIRKPAEGARPGMVNPQRWVREMWGLAKELDPTRLVEDMSVCHWEHLEYYLHGSTDINSWHFYLNDYQKAKEHIQKVVNSTFVGSSYNYVPGFLHQGQPLINSEYGGIGALDGDKDVSWSFKFLTNELRRHQQIAAYIYTELHDVEWEYNGFLNYDRTPKDFGYDPRIINESNALPIDAPPIQRMAPGGMIRLEVTSSHFSTRRYVDVSLHWILGGMDTRGRFYQELAKGHVPIPFPHRRVAPAHLLELRLPGEPMLCTLGLSALSNEGEILAQNFLHYFVSAGYPPEREETPRTLILRAVPGKWSAARWGRVASSRDQAIAEDTCAGFGAGYFEWRLPLGGVSLARAQRLKVLGELSAHRSDAPQTDGDIFPTTLEIQLNDVPLHHSLLRNHPHDSRGALSYLRGGAGAYGYLIQAVAEGKLLRAVQARGAGDELRLRCGVPTRAEVQGGLTVYGAECGRYPVGPTILVDW